MGVFLFVPESPTIHKDILTWAAANGYTVHKDWWGINELRLTSFRDPKRTTRRFWILLFVRESYKNNPVKSSFQLRNNSETRDASIDLEEDDLLHNFTTSTSQLMNGSIPWLGAREKDPRLVQILVEASTSPGDIVLDYNASTGASVHACRSTGHHLIAMESDPAIFKDVLEALKDLIDVLRTATKKRAASNSLIDDNIPASSVKRPRFYKGLVRIGVTEMLDEIRSPDGSFHLPCYIEPLTTTFAEILSQVIAPSKSRASRGFICSSQILGFGCP